MSILFTNKDQKQLQLRKKIMDYVKEYGIQSPNIPMDTVANPNLIKDFLVVSEPYINALKGKKGWKDVEEKVRDRHIAMDTSAAKSLFYYLSSYSIGDTFSLKDGMSPDKIIQNAIKFDNILYQYATDRNQAKNTEALQVAKQTGITAFDLETMGDGAITDFHFEKVGAGGFDPNNRTYFSSAIGINASQKEKYEEILDKFIQKGEEFLNSEERITLYRLNKIGSNDTIINIRDANRALYKYEKLDAPNELSVGRIKAGISRLHDMGTKQAASAINGIRPVVQEMIDGYFSSDVLGGHKIKDFDMPRVYGFFNDKTPDGNLRYVSKEEQELFNSKLKEKAPKFVDSFQIARQIEHQIPMNVRAEQMKHPAFGKHKALYNSQSGLIIRNGKADLLENASLHAAEHDTLIWVNGIYQTDFVNGGVSVNPLNKEVKIGSIFTIGNDHANNKALTDGIIYERDGLQQDIRFGSGFVYRNGQESFIQNGFPVVGTKTNYMLAGMSKVTTAVDSSLEKIGLSGKELYTASFVPMIEGAKEDLRYAKMQDSVLTIVAESKDELEEKISSLVFVGKRKGIDKDSTLDKIREEANKGILPEDIVIDQGLSPQLEEITTMYDQASGEKVNRNIGESLNLRYKNKITEDLATRRIRGNEYGFWRKLIELSDRIAKNVSVNNVASVGLNDMIEIVSYTHDGKKFFQSNSIRNLTFARQYAKVLEPFARAALQRTKSIQYGKDKAFAYMYEHMLNSIRNKANITGNIHSTTLRELSIEDMNTFDIDISELIHRVGKVSQEIDPYEIQHPNIVSIRMDKIDNSFTSSLVKAIYGNEASNVESPERIKILHNVMKLLNKNLGKDLFTDKQIKEFVSEGASELGIVSFISSKLQEHVNELRAEGKETNQHLYPRNKQTLEEEASELVKQGIVKQGKDGTYELADSFGDIENYADDALKAYKLKNAQRRESVEKKIDSIVEDILFKNSNVSRQELKRFGYSDEQIKLLLAQREVRKHDTKEFLKETFGVVFGSDNPRASLSYDSKNGIVSIISQGEQIEANVLQYLPIDVYDPESGSFYTKLGGMNIINSVGITVQKNYQTGEISRLSYGTSLQQAMFDRGWMGYSLRNGINNGTSAESLINIFKDINKQLRTSVQGPGTSAYADLRPIINNLPELVAKGIITDEYVSEKLIKTALSFTGKEIDATKNIGVDYYNLVWNNMQGILKSIATHGKERGMLDTDAVVTDILDLANNIIVGDKPNAHGFAETVVTEGVVTRDNRGIGAASQRSVPIDTSLIDDGIINVPQELRKDIKRTSGLIRTKAETNRDSRGEGYRSNVVVKRLNIHHAELLEKLKTEKLSETTKRIFGRNTFTAEGGGIINPYLADTLFNDQVSDQKINFKDLADLQFLDEDNREKEKIRRIDQSYRITFNEKTGEYEFRYGPGRHVRTNDTIAMTFDNYTGFKAEKAKHEGIVKTVFFDKRSRKIASEKMINSIIADWVKQNQATIKSTQDRMELITLISDHLSNILDRKIINKSFEANTYAKVIENQAEKGMRFSPIAGLGDVDPRIGAFLERIGAKELIGRGLSIDALKHLFGGEDDFRALAAYLGKKGEEDSSANIRKAIGEIFGPEEKKSLIENIMEERYQPFHEFTNVILGQQNENIGIISNTAADALKHNEMRGAFNYVFAQIDGLDDEKIRNQFIKRANRAGVFGRGNYISYYDDKGFVLSKGVKYINVDKLQKIVKDTTGQDLEEDTFNYLNGITQKAYYDKALLSRAEDHEKASYASFDKGFKYTKRDADNMLANIYDKESLAEARGVIAKATGDRKFAENVFVGREEGLVYRDALLNMRGKIFAQDFDKLVLKDGEIQAGRIKRFAQRTGLDEDHLFGIVKRIRSSTNDIRNIDESYLEKAYTADMHFLARSYNMDTGRTSEAALQKYNFKSMNIGELITSKGSNELFESNMYNKNLLIDLTDIGLTTSKGKSKIAIPVLTTGFMAEDKEATSEILNKLAALNSRAKEFKNLDESDEVARSAYQRSMSKTLGQIESLLEARHGKEGPVADLSTTRLLHSSSSSKAQIIDLANLAETFPNWKFRGKSIAKMANNGMEINAVFVGQSRLEEMLGSEYFDQLKKIGVSKEDWLKHVEEFGIVGTVNRKPSEYENSMATARIYLDPTMKGGQTKVSQSLAYAMHLDLDGDIVGTSIITEGGRTSEGNVVDVDSATQELLATRKNSNASLQITDPSLQFIGRRMKRIDDATLYASATVGHRFMQSVKAPNLTPVELPQQNLLRGFLINGNYYAEAFGADRENLEETWQRLGQHDDFRDIINKKSKMELLDFKIAVEDQIAQTFGNTSEGKSYEAALGHYLNTAFAERATMAYAGKKGTGLVNYHTQKFRTVLAAMVQSENNPLSARQESIIQTALVTVDDKFLGSKNTGRDMSEALEKLGRATTNALGENSDPSELIDLLVKDFDIINEKWMKKAFGDSPVTQEELVETFHTFTQEGKGFNSAIKEALKTGMGTGANTSSVTYYLNGEYDAAAVYFNSLSQEAPDLVESVDNVFSKGRPQAFDSGSVEFPDMSASKTAQKSMRESFVDALKNTKVSMKGSLAKSAVGIAGAIMLTGFIGGNPSRDEDEIAMNNQMAHQKNPGYVPSMNQYNQQQMSSLGGYKVNVKASSPYNARQSSAAINQSFSQHTRGNVNMNMNINNRSQRPNRRDIDDYFDRAI